MKYPALPPRAIPADDALWFTDNGALLCGRHLGMSAAYTGRDVSGQKIVRADDADLLELERAVGHAVDCETCTRTARPTNPPGWSSIGGA